MSTNGRVNNVFIQRHIERERARAVEQVMTGAFVDDLAVAIAARLHPAGEDCWLDTQQAAAYLSRPISTIRKLTGSKAIPFEQATPHARCYFRRSALDAWMQSGCRPL